MKVARYLQEGEREICTGVIPSTVYIYMELFIWMYGTLLPQGPKFDVDKMYGDMCTQSGHSNVNDRWLSISGGEDKEKDCTQGPPAWAHVVS